MRQKFFITPFAATGDRESPPDPQQPDGSVSYSVGFGPDYEADPASNPNAKPVPREETNGIFHDVTEAVSALQREGAPEFISADDNGGTAFAYSRGAMVRWSSSGNPPFTTYVSRVNNNTAAPSNTTNWAPLLFEAATNAQAIAGTSTTLLITPASLAAALNSASVTVPDATTSVKGVQRNATNAEAQAGTLGDATVTPASLSSALGAYSFNASQVASGTLAAARIPSLPASQISSGTLAVARVPNLNASKITDGVFDAARIPAINIAASQVASGTLAAARIPSLDAGKVTSGKFAMERIPVPDIQLGAWQIVSGVLPLARGGTGLASLTAGAYLRASGTGGSILQFTPEQVRADIGAAALAGGNTFLGNQTFTELVSNTTGRYQASTGTPFYGVGTGAFIRPNGWSTAGQTQWASSGNMTVAGSVTATGGFQGSSRTVKRDIRAVPAREALDMIESVAAVSYAYRPEYRDDDGRRSYGFIAEDLRDAVPEAVVESDGPSPLVVEHSQLIAVLWAAVQHLSARVQELEDRT